MPRPTLGMLSAPLVGVVALLLPHAANAADIPVKAPVFKAPVVASVQSWSGFYIGANAGYSWGPWDSTSVNTLFAVASTTASPKVDGWLAGLQAGYNWQIDRHWLFGIEADYQITGEKASDGWTEVVGPINFADGTLTVTNTQSSEWKFPWFATIRARAGYVADDWLLYVTGGAAVGRAEFGNTSTGTLVFTGQNPINLTLTTGGSQAATKWGWTAGGGVEKALGHGFSAKLEYLYLDLGSHVFLPGTALETDVRLRDHIVRLGLNWRFGAPLHVRF